MKLLKRLDLQDLAGLADLFAKDFVWHYVNPNLPEMEGDYEGIEGAERGWNDLARFRHDFRIRKGNTDAPTKNALENPEVTPLEGNISLRAVFVQH